MQIVKFGANVDNHKGEVHNAKEKWAQCENHEREMNIVQKEMSIWVREKMALKERWKQW
jgi:hypothetical protein